MTEDDAAYELGAAAVQALNHGDLYQGPLFACEAAGYIRATQPARSFVAGYLHALAQRFPRGVPVAVDTGRIAEAEEAPRVALVGIPRYPPAK